MKRGFFLVVLLAGSVSLAAQERPTGPVAPAGPDLSGSWTLESMSGAPGSGAKAGWGPRATIGQSGAELSVQPVNGSRLQFKTDGSEVATVLSSEPCRTQVRITKAEATATDIRITTWLITQTNCFHGESALTLPEDPEREIAASSAALLQTRILKGKRALESVTVISRQGDKLNVESTQSVPGGAPASTSATYRK